MSSAGSNSNSNANLNSNLNSSMSMSGNSNYQFIIKFSDNSRDLSVPITDASHLTAVWLRKTIRNLRPEETKTRRLRFIYGGKVLTNNKDFGEQILRLKKRVPLDNTGVGSGSSASASASADSSARADKSARAPVLESELENEQHAGPEKIYIHCLVGEQLTAEELANEEALDSSQQQQRQTTTPAPMGFDRLLSQGFSQQDISELRRQFAQLYGDVLHSGNSEDIRQLEDRWIDSTVNNEIDDFNTMTGGINNTRAGGGNIDTNTDLLVGILVGSLLGVLALFLLKLDSWNYFTKRTKMAIVAGVIVNFSFAVVRAWS
ncbi:hypothetical protein PACTADRAFT_77604 [Pachysolen tannophilus NRRL Y-2460]|uniref:Ubiquitin-like domain-containing protein n=1 Tax=Pachysolen tannophilus NRRL Y-2460 TaxID=669874 RepID=A0A1E4TNE0_PACTA|nr:hypothetical protein PACTADRAFT_77604 [Pachysolen tannophilus NRRL Y-2460]